MKLLLSSRRLFILGMFLLVVTNVVVLGGIAANRNGNPEAQVVLTEREIQMPNYSRKENNGLALLLKWRVDSVGDDSGFSSRWNSPGWFDETKLKELGFQLPDYANVDDSFNKHKQPVSKEVFIVLESESPLLLKAIETLERLVEKEKKLLLSDKDNREFVKRVTNAEDRLRYERTMASRLFVLDVGLDAKQLREQYPDRTGIFITKGKVNYRFSYKGNGKEKITEITGFISGLSVGNIHVPLDQRKKFVTILEAKKTKNKDETPRYQVELAYGHRFEPWIVAIRDLSEK